MTYTYLCAACQHQWEQEQGIKEPALTRCILCLQETAKRIIVAGGNFILKGSGWFNSGGY